MKAAELAALGTPWTPTTLFAGGEKGGVYAVRDWSKLFQDTAGATPVTAAGQTVKRINDISGNGLHVTNSTGWVLGVDANGFSYLTMDGASAFKASPAWSGTALTIGAAVNTESTPSGNEQLVSIGSVADNDAYGGLRLQNTTGYGQFFAEADLGNVSVTATSQGIPADAHVHIAQTGGPTLYRDRLSTTGTGSITTLTGFDVLTIGALSWFGVTNSYASGKFYGAVIVTRSITTDERATLNAWLRGLYGVEGTILGCLDSHTLNVDYGQTETNFYPKRLEVLLRAAGRSYQSINLGISGNTTANMVARMTQATLSGPHAVAVLYGSTNDSSGTGTVQAAPAPTATAFTVDATFGNRYGAGSLLKLNGVQYEVLSVVGDRITLTTAPAVPPAAGQSVEIDTYSNLVKIGQALQAAGTTRILVPGLHYYNFVSGLGDTTTSQAAGTLVWRVIQEAAATALGAVYVDLYDYMRDLIVAGTYAQGNDTAWHVGVGNAHLNNTGEQIVADALHAAMRAQGWT